MDLGRFLVEAVIADFPAVASLQWQDPKELNLSGGAQLDLLVEFGHLLVAHEDNKPPGGECLNRLLLRVIEIDDSSL